MYLSAHCLVVSLVTIPKISYAAACCNVIHRHNMLYIPYYQSQFHKGSEGLSKPPRRSFTHLILVLILTIHLHPPLLFPLPSSIRSFTLSSIFIFIILIFQIPYTFPILSYSFIITFTCPICVFFECAISGVECCSACCAVSYWIGWSDWSAMLVLALTRG